jgi:hypothetical protein
MPSYTFTGAYPRVLTGLSEGVNAHLSPDAPAHGATIEARPGDAVHTDQPYQHPELVETAPDAITAPEPAPAAPEVAPEPVAEPAPEPEPAHDAMTAEGAPAPATA